MRALRIQYVSNLHLERFASPNYYHLVKPCAPYLALAGNISTGSNNRFHLYPFLNYCSRHWSYTVYSPSEKEVCSDESLLQLLHVTQRFSNMRLLHAGSPSTYFPYENLSFVGASYKEQIWYHDMIHAGMCVVSHAPPDRTLLSTSRVKAWIYGDAKNFTTEIVGDTILTANPHGTDGFSKQGWIEFPYTSGKRGVAMELAASAAGTKLA